MYVLHASMINPLTLTMQDRLSSRIWGHNRMTMVRGLSQAPKHETLTACIWGTEPACK